MHQARPRLAALCALVASLGAAHIAHAQLFKEKANALSPQPCGGNGCYTNYLRVTDIDGDGDLDIVMPNSGGGGPQPLVVWQNDGQGNFTDVSQSAVGGFAGHLRQIAVGDVDGDGDGDIYAPDATGQADKLFINDGMGVFTDEYAARMPPGLGSHAAATRMGDVDGDGDLDLFVGDRFSGGSGLAAHLYLNDGTGHFTDATANLPTTTAGDVPYDFDLFDADRDWDLDLLIDMHNGTSMFWKNDGAGHFTESPFPGQSGLKYGPVACDVDGDKDLDLWFDNAGPGYTEQLLINDGTGTFADETAARVNGNPGADDNGVACIDADGDGDLDAAIMSLSDEERVLTNDGTGHFTLLPNAFSPAGDSTLWFEFGDLNGDGRLDCVTGQGESGSFVDRVYFGQDPLPVDTVAPRIVSVEAGPTTVDAAATIPVRFAVSDNATTDEGPRLERSFARVKAGSDQQDVLGHFVGGDLFRVVLPAQPKGGTIQWQACATDRQGNEACADALTYQVTGGTGGNGSGGDGTGGNGTGADGTGASGTGASGTGASAADGGTEDDTGCGCRLADDKHSDGAAWAALLGLTMLACRRREPPRS